MLPSEITGPGPHANDGAHHAWSNRPHREWVEATNAGQTHRPVERVLGMWNLCHGRACLSR